ncbi:hypothetical protein M758_8G077600 [Ceratodon purpureus]|nr:hypothetical protein M758_8G077600 [Ceratodon purpureus]
MAMATPPPEDCGSTFIRDVLSQHPAQFADLLADAPRFRFQVLLSVPLPGVPKPRLARHGFRVDHEYFYPASAIKLCAAVAAVQKLDRIRSLFGINVNCITPVGLYSLFEGVEDDRSDPSNINQKQITVAHEIRKIFLVSDNQAFNRLFSFVGHRTINQAMWDLGMQSTRLHHRLSERRSGAENLYSEAIDINEADTVFTLPPKHSELILEDNSGLPGVRVGTGYIADDGQLVPQPMDFSKKNYMSTMDLQDLLIKLVRPDIKVETTGLELDAAMRVLLMEAMAQYPSQSANPKYDGTDYPDDYCKFFLPGLSRVRPKGALRIYNKIGRAYGFTIDNSYVFDIETGRSFFLTAVIYTNANGVLNDDKYEYEYADRILADLAEVLGRALWQLPDSSAALSSPLDCTPSSLWPSRTKPPTISTFSESRTATQENEDSKLPAEDKSYPVEKMLPEPVVISSAEDHSLSRNQSPVQQITSNIVVPEEGSMGSPKEKQNSSGCSSILQLGADKPVQTDTTNLPTTAEQQSYTFALLPITQVSPSEVVSSPPCADTFKSIKPCYKYFLDE